jgi:hypothetical protein
MRPDCPGLSNSGPLALISGRDDLQGEVRSAVGSSSGSRVASFVGGFLLPVHYRMLGGIAFVLRRTIAVGVRLQAAVLNGCELGHTSHNMERRSDLRHERLSVAGQRDYGRDRAASFSDTGCKALVRAARWRGSNPALIMRLKTNCGLL